MHHKTHLDGLSDVLQTRSDDAEQTIKSDHFLHQHSVHALFVGGRVLPESGISVKVRWNLRQNVLRYVIHNFIRGFSTSRRSFSLHKQSIKLLFIWIGI